MTTDKIAVQSVSELRLASVPTKTPIYAAITKTQKYPFEIKSLTLKDFTSTGGKEPEKINVQSTEKKSSFITPTNKTFEIDFFGEKIRVGTLQNKDGLAKAISLRLNDYQGYMDSKVWNGTDNKGLYTNLDANAVVNDSYATDWSIADLYKKLYEMKNVQDREVGAGRQTLLVFGDTAVAAFGTYNISTDKDLNNIIAQNLNMNIVLVPSSLISATNGVILFNNDFVVHHYAALPQLQNSGENVEDGYTWNNLIMSTSMIDVEAKYGLIKQVLTTKV